MELYRKRLSKEEKYSIMQEHFDNGVNLSELARKHKLHPITLYAWKRKMKDSTNQLDSEYEALRRENEQLKKEKHRLTRALGEVSLENQAQKDIIEFLKKKEQERQLKKQKSSLEIIGSYTKKL